MSSLFRREKIDIINKYGLSYITKSILGLSPDDEYINEEFIKNHIEFGTGKDNNDPHFILKDIQFGYDNPDYPGKFIFTIDGKFFNNELSSIIDSNIIEKWNTKLSDNIRSTNSRFKIGLKNIKPDYTILLSGLIENIEFINLDINKTGKKPVYFKIDKGSYLNYNIRLDGGLYLPGSFDEDDYNIMNKRIREFININNYNNILIKNGIYTDCRRDKLPPGFPYYNDYNQRYNLYINDSNGKNIKITKEMEKYYGFTENNLEKQDDRIYYTKYF